MTDEDTGPCLSKPRKDRRFLPFIILPALPDKESLHRQEQDDDWEEKDEWIPVVPCLHLQKEEVHKKFILESEDVSLGKAQSQAIMLRIVSPRGGPHCNSVFSSPWEISNTGGTWYENGWGKRLELRR